MKINLFWNSILLSILSSFALASKDGCREITDYLKTFDHEMDIISCTNDEEGNPSQLTFYSYCMTEEELNTIVSYDSLKYIKIDLLSAPNSTGIDFLRVCGTSDIFPSAISKLNNLETIDFYGFTNFKKGDIAMIPKSVKNLYLSDFEINQSIIDDLSTLTNLELLSMRTRFADGVNLEPLKSLKLKKLIFSNDDLYMTTKKYLDPSVAKYIETLKILEVDSYALSQETIDEIATHTNLKELNLINCGYDENVTIDAFKNLVSLESLSIDGDLQYCSESVNLFSGYSCPLYNFSEAIYSLTGLKKLILRGHGSNFVYSELLANLTNLEYLDLSSNNMKSFPEAISQLTNLQYLDLSFNSFTTISDAICELVNLKELYLKFYSYESSKVTELPSCIGNLKSLEIISLNNSDSLAKLPESFGNLKNLKQLYVIFLYLFII